MGNWGASWLCSPPSRPPGANIRLKVSSCSNAQAVYLPQNISKKKLLGHSGRSKNKTRLLRGFPFSHAETGREPGASSRFPDASSCPRASSTRPPNFGLSRARRSNARTALASRLLSAPLRKVFLFCLKLLVVSWNSLTFSVFFS